MIKGADGKDTCNRSHESTNESQAGEMSRTKLYLLGGKGKKRSLIKLSIQSEKRE